MEARIERANKLSSKELTTMLLNSEDSSNQPSGFDFEALLANELSDTTKIPIWDIFANNMHDIYESSGYGWDPSSKKDELFDPDMRYILAWQPVESGGERTLAAYTAFRFDMEDDEPVVYCYDLQISGVAQRRGVGRYFVDALHLLGQHTGLERLMLTVQRGNEDALKFYHATGFEVDDSSPDCPFPLMDEGWASYEDCKSYAVLSKAITPK